MGVDTKIQWANHTFNPVVGCTKVSAACDFCYAETWAKRTGQPQLWAGERRRTSEANWHEPIKWNAQAAKMGVRHRVFCASLADVFDNQWEEKWRLDLYDLIMVTPHLDWLLLTKRPQNILKMTHARYRGHFPDNMWLGTTVENQEEAERRIPHLMRVPARVRFLSCEPLLGPVKILSWLERAEGSVRGLLGQISWVIIGGESGARDKARPFQLAWANDLIDQCRYGDVAPFVKQLGRNPVADDGSVLDLKDSHGGDMAEWPDEMRIREFPQVRAA